jgi:NAD(P)-dependent dehydrogenase (short-subunit alcohol dehydrogenase family)
MTDSRLSVGFLNERVALVTGGAKRIGAAIARKLAANGAAVAVHYHESESEALSLAEELQATGAEVFLVQGDLADPETATDLVGQAVHAAGRPLNILINNASIFEPGGLGVSGGTLWDRHEAVNLRAPFLLARAFAGQLPKFYPGDIINLNDIRALKPGPGYLAYTASKVGLSDLTKSLAREMAPGIRVNEVALGAVLPPDKPAGEYQHVLREELLLQAFPTVDQVTDCLMFLLYNTAVTGQTICVDGGQHLR